MANRIAIMGGEPYAEWIERGNVSSRRIATNDPKATRNAWRRVLRAPRRGRHAPRLQFNNEDEWCAQCGTPIDPDSGDHYSCDVFDCDAVLCDDCGSSLTCDGYYCPQHRRAKAFTDSKEPTRTRSETVTSSPSASIRTIRRLRGERDELQYHSRLGQGRVAGTQRGGIAVQYPRHVQTARLEAHRGIWRERGRTHPRSPHAEPVVLGATRTGGAPVPTAQHAPR